MAVDMAAPFVWGSGGRRLTPEEILMERKAATALGSEAMSTAPVGHWSQGLNRVLQGLMAGYDSYSADQASKTNASESAARIAQMIGGAATPATPVAPQASAAPTTTAPLVAPPMGKTSIPPSDNAARAMAFFQSKGLSPEDSAAMVWNFQQESGRGINPTLSHDGGTGYGIAGFRDPKPGQGRWTNLRNFAADRRLDPADLETQLEYSWSELQGSENAALRAIQAATTPEAKAAAAIGYFRPRADYAADRASRSNEVRSLLGAAPPVQVASIGQDIPVAAATSNMPIMAPQARSSTPVISPQSNSNMPVIGQSSANINPIILQSMTSPYASDQERQIATSLFKNNLEQQQKANDPLRKLQIREAESKLTPLSEPYRDSDGNLVQKDPMGKVTMLAPSRTQFSDIGTDPTTGNPIKGFVSPDAKKVEPYKMPGSENAAPSTLPPVPPGVDPKLWREGQSKEAILKALPGSFDDTAKLRGEFTGLPSYKNLSQAAPIYRSMSDAAGRNTKAADLNMVYGLGKIMDPGSVVREGEIQMANNAQGWQEKLNGIIGQINNEGGLTPAGRQALMAEAYSRIAAYKGEFDQDAERYRGIAGRNRINADDVVPSFGDFKPWEAPKTGQPIVIDGYKIKAR